MAEKRHIITLLTDYGTKDHFASSLKGAILSVNTNVDIVDITHDIAPQDVFGAALVLRNAYKTFPRFTIHIAIVDPTVGSERRPIIVMTDNYNFIGPDNGIFSYIYHEEEVNRVIRIDAPHYYRMPVSATFHGRDIFAPIAGWITKGVDPRKMGEEITDYVRFAIPQPQVTSGLIRGHVIHIDHFGNCVTNISTNELTNEIAARNKVLLVNNHQIARFCRFYAECPDGEACALFGSAGLLEIAVPKSSAAQLLGIVRGMEVALHYAV
ncbi:MAG: SAM-dependent chlorinase/fluorinase [Acidobacteriota bacterium]|nr:SAM-dependent chlorinase/fluorinase [Blastocatellia bacterium]MDW8413574.1 SAM-dependent chlorinase/fluorinase [Acidobacteriota bacterium]